MYKVGDKFEVVSGGKAYGVSVGDIVTWVRDCPYDVGYFKSSSGLEFPAAYGDNTANISTTVRPIRTEAEKRGAKFGMMGVVKETSAVKYAIGKKILFVGIAQTFLKEEVWNCVIEGETEVTTFSPSNIRLDHEPEYKEIPFSMGTHEQRMDANNLRGLDGSEIDEIHVFKNGSYGFTRNGDPRVWQDVTYLTVRIPA